MKKDFNKGEWFILVFVIILGVFSLTACNISKPSGMSDKAYKLGLESLTVADKYLASELPKERAWIRLDEIKDKIDELQKAEEMTSSSLSNMHTTILHSSTLNLAAAIQLLSDDDVLKSRNDLAEALGKKTVAKEQ